MQKVLLFVDKLSTWVGQAFSLCIVLLTLHVSWEVFSRYALDAPRAWAFDVMIYLYGTLFMMAGAYTLSRNGHVRGDVLYRFLPPKLQAGLDLGLYLLFFIPGIAALAWFGVGFFWESWGFAEKSQTSSSSIPIYPLKLVIPIAGGLLLLQGAAEISRCMICLKRGQWPQRLHDVEEIDVEELKADLDAGQRKEGR